MNAQDLKNSILQLAVQGKLVEQKKEEGTAKELLAQIKAKKLQLIEEKKIKKEKPLPEIAEEEKLFDIPESWEWVRLRDLGITQTGNTPSKSHMEYFGDFIPFISPGDILNGVINYQNQGLSEKGKEVGRVIEKYSILQVCIGGSIGKCAINSMDVTFNQQINAITPIVSSYEYIYYLLSSGFFQLNIKTMATGTATPIINKSAWENLVVPLPPLEEQRRIVTMIEELMPYIEKYGEAHSKLEVFNKKFPEDMQKSILQYAIQGKLVEQRSEEGTAEELYSQIKKEAAKLIKKGEIKKEKPLPEITEDEIPFEIPEGWKWVYINEIAFVTKLAGFEYTKYLTGAISVAGDVPIVRAQNIKPNRFIRNENEFITMSLSEQLKRSALDRRCVLMTFIGAGIGEVAIFKNEKRHHLAPNVAKIVPHIDINDYLLFYLMSDVGRRQIFQYMKQTAQPSLSMETIRKAMIPIPPLEEQKRIVNKIEKMLPYCQQLMK